MFYCKRCSRDYPDDTEYCPICGAVNARLAHRKFSTTRFLISLADLLTFLMTIFNVALLLTCSHYALSYESGILFAHRQAYYKFPALAVLEAILAVLLILMIYLAVLGHLKMEHKRQRAGLWIMVADYVLILLWNIVYPTTTYVITGTVSPILPLLLGCLGVYACIAAVLSLLLYRNKNLNN